MEASLSALKILVPLAYLLATAAYGRLFFSTEEARFAGKAQLTQGLALGLHTVFLIALGWRFQRCPLATIGEGLLFTAWILSAIHFLSEWLADTRRLGLFTLLPTTLCVLVSLFFLQKNLDLPPEYRSSWFVFHIVASLASYACFSMAAILAGLYLVQHRKLKSKNFDLTFRKLPPLEKLDKLSATWSLLGTLTMITASVIGVWWVQKDGLAGMSLKEFAIYLILAVFLGAGIARPLFSVRGRQYAIVVLVGFVVLLLTNLLGTHGFKA
jgi:ABC-type uncharacterized transport system permease subunit